MLGLKFSGFMAAAVVGSALSFVACSSDDDPDPNASGGNAGEAGSPSSGGSSSGSGGSTGGAPAREGGAPASEGGSAGNG